jgi:hypothetical protein
MPPHRLALKVGVLALLARCGQVHLVFHSDLNELGQINYNPIMVKQLNCKLIPQ